jgi:hypothetical protein
MRRSNPSTSKALEKELKSDSFLMLSFGVAKELGMTVQQLHANVTYEELLGWSAYFSIINKQQEEAMEKARKRR